MTQDILGLDILVTIFFFFKVDDNVVKIRT